MTSIPLISARILHFGLAKKTKPLRAKHIQHLMTDISILSKLPLSTLEGRQTINANSMICLGVEGEAWQQTSKNLLKKYNVTGLDESGWLICEPKPDNEVWAAQTAGDADEQFKIIAQWGEIQPNGTFLQYGKSGDYVLQSKTDPTDIWIVAEKIFDSTYTFME